MDRLADTPLADNQDGWGRNSYRGNAGSDTGEMTGTGTPANQVERNNGIFITNRVVKLKDVIDGTAHTALLSEKVRGDGDNTAVEIVSDWFRISEGNITADQVATACRARRVDDEQGPVPILARRSELAARELRGVPLQPCPPAERPQLLAGQCGG